MMKAACIPGLLLILSAAGCSSQPVQLGAMSSSPIAVELSADEVAERLRNAYEQASFIHVVGATTTSTGVTYEYQYDGTRDSFRTICFRDGRLCDAFSFHDGRVQELIPGDPQRNVLNYAADREIGISRFKCDREHSCLYGMYTVVWLGPEQTGRTLQPHLVAQRISESKQVGEAEVEGRHCLVFEWSQRWINRDQETISNTWRYSIDAERFVIRRMEAVFSTSSGTMVTDRETRTFEMRRMDVMSHEPAMDWDIASIVDERRGDGLRVAQVSPWSGHD